MPDTADELLARIKQRGQSAPDTADSLLARVKVRATPAQAASARSAIYGDVTPESMAATRDAAPADDATIDALLETQGHSQRVESEIAKWRKELDRGSFPGIFKPAPSEQALAFERMGEEGYRKAERDLAIKRMGGVPTTARARQTLDEAKAQAQLAEDESALRREENPVLRYGARLAVDFKEGLEKAGAYVRENIVRPFYPESARAMDRSAAEYGMSEEGKDIVRRDTKGLLGDVVGMVGQTAAFIPQVALGGVPGAAAVSAAAAGGDVMAGVETAAFLKGAGALTKFLGGNSESVVRQMLAESMAMPVAGIATRLGFHGDAGDAKQAIVDTLSGIAFSVMGGGARARESAAKFKSALEMGKTIDAAAAESGIPAGRLKLPDAGKPLPVPEKPILEVPDAPNLKRGKTGPEVMAEVAKRAETAVPVNEALRRFEERTGIKVAPESPAPTKPVSVAPKAPAAAPRATPKAEPAPVEKPATRNVAPATPDVAAPPVDAPRPEGVSIKNAAVEADRAARGAAPLPETKPEKMADWVAEATKRVKENPNYTTELIDKLKREGGSHDKVEAAALVEHRVGLNKALEKAESDVIAAAERGDLDAVKEAKIRADDLRTRDFEVSELVGKAAGAEAARALGARAMALDHQYELLPMETRRRVVNDGKPLTREQKAETKAIHDEFVAAKEMAKRVGPVVTTDKVRAAEYGRRNAFVTREVYDATRAALREKLNRMSVNPLDPAILVDLAKIGAFHLEAGARSFASWSKAMIEDMGEAARPHLREVWRASKLSMGDPGKPQAERLKAMTSRLEMAAADYNARVATGKLLKTPREPVVMDDAAIRAEAKMIAAKRRWETALFRDEWNNKNVGQKAVSMALSGLHNIPRALMAGFDLSATGMQGGVGFLARPNTGGRAFVESIKSFRSREYADRSEAQIRLDPMYHDAKASKLFLAEHNTHQPKNTEEVVLTGFLSKIPILAGSQRAYVAFMNRMRFDMFKAGVASMSKDGAKPTPAEMRSWAALVNTFTGRAGSAENRALNGAASILWAPRLVLSRFSMLTGYPLLKSTGAARKLAAMEYARYAMGLGIIYGAAKLAGAKIDDDGKIQAGTTKIDPTSGLSSAYRFLKQMGGAAKDSVQGRDTENTKNAWKNIVRYGRYKLAPLVGSTVNVLNREDPVGKRTDIKKEAVDLVTPLSVEDIRAAFKKHNVPEATVLSLLTILGVRSSEKPTKGR